MPKPAASRRFSYKYCLVLPGRPPAHVADLSHRFSDARVFRATGQSVIECYVAGHSLLRSLMTQLWDVGGTVLLVADVTTGQKGPDLP